MQVTRRAVGTAAVTAFICANCASPGQTPDPSDGRSYPAVPEFDWPVPVREVLVACTGRLQPEHVLKAFESGADLVLTVSCDKDECRYLQGSERWTRRAEYVQTILDEVGLGGRRLMVFHMPGTAAADTAASTGRPEAVGEERLSTCGSPPSVRRCRRPWTAWPPTLCPSRMPADRPRNPINNRTQARKPMKTDLRQALESGRLVLTAECAPPRSGGAEAVNRLSSLLPPRLDAVVVADNPDQIHGSALACAAILAREGREVVLSMSTRDRNRVALESDALGASALGIGAILCVSGNHQSLGACPQAAGANDMDSMQLTRALKNLVEVPELVVGAVAHPYQRPLELNLIRVKKKIAAGAEFLLTQPVFDTAAFTLWMDAVRAAGLDKQYGHHRKRAAIDQS